MKISKEELRDKIRGAIYKAASGERLYTSEKDDLADVIAEKIHEQNHPIFDHPWYYPGREYLGIIEEVVQENFSGYTTCLSDNADIKRLTWTLFNKNMNEIDSFCIDYGNIEPDVVNSVMHRWRVDILKSIIAHGIEAKIKGSVFTQISEACKSHPFDINEARVERVEFLLGELVDVRTTGQHDNIAAYKKRHRIKELAQLLIK